MHENMLFFVEKVATLITFYRARLLLLLGDLEIQLLHG